MTEQELEERISRMIDEDYQGMAERFERESITGRIKAAILKHEIESLKKAVEEVENVSGLSGIQGTRTDA